MIELKNLTKTYRLGKTLHHAVHNVSLTLEKGQILGLVGPSGSGKSTLGKLLLRLIPPTSGQILLDGREITHSPPLPHRMQMVFQDPSTSLNPRMTVYDILSEPTHIHNLPNRTYELLDAVRLPRTATSRYPHEFSGGERQRIGIARALALQPSLLILDEPLSALDLSTQAQIVNLLLRLHKELHLTYLFISHDLPMVQYLATRILHMDHGQAFEYRDSALKSTKIHIY